MKVFTPKKVLTLAVLIVIQANAFGQQKESWLKKTWHNMNARYNGLYHAKAKLAETKTSLKDQHVDDYTQILRVFPYGTESQRVAQKPTLDEVYKKCSQVIKKHPKSRWVDDAWYLIGQSYLLQNDLFTAIETYQYVAQQFPNGEKKYDAKLGILMAYIAQDKFYDAEAIMSVIKKEGKFPERLDQEVAAISAEIYIQEEKYRQAIEALEKALSLSKIRDERSRYHFILGQLYLATQDVEKAKSNYIKTIKLNPPYEMAFQSNLGLIKTISLSSEKSLKTPRKYLKKMLADDKNIDYYDQIYYELANLEMLAKNESEAIKYYQMSAQTSVKNQDQKANSFLALATIYFGKKEFELSQKYFDSTAMFVSKTRPDYEYIKAKQSVLTDLIENLITIETEDSLLQWSELSKEELAKRINQRYERDVRLAELEKERKEQNSGQVDDFDPFGSPSKVQNNSLVGGSWYFYNQSAMARGTNDFKRKWGTRPKTDLWRYVSLQQGLVSNDSENQDEDSTESTPNADISYDADQDPETKKILSDVSKEKKKYYKNIPFSDEAKQAANARIEEALFNTGKIYYEDLKEYPKSRGYLLDLLKKYPEGVNEAETYFILNKIETELGNPEKAQEYSDLLNEKYPKSPFNLVLNNRELAQELGGNNEVSKLYQAAYDAYRNGDFEKALAIKKEASEKYAGNSLQAKFEYLNTMIIGKTEGKDAFIKELQRIIDLYPSTDVGNHAEYTLQLLMEQGVEDPNEEASERYAFKPSEEHYFIVVFDGGKKTSVLAGFSDYNRKMHQSENLRSNSYIVGDKNTIAVQSFKDKDAAEKYYVEFLKKDKFFKDLGVQAYDLFIISQSNFRILLGDKNSDAYSLFFVRNYIQ